jgi:hypothetical protein
VVGGDEVAGGVVGGGAGLVVTVGGEVGGGDVVGFAVIGALTTVFLRVVGVAARAVVTAVVTASVTGSVVGASVATVVGSSVVTVVVTASVLTGTSTVVVVRPFRAALACRGLMALSPLMTLLPTTRTPSMVIAVAAPVPSSHTSAITARRVPRIRLLLDPFDAVDPPNHRSSSLGCRDASLPQQSPDCTHSSCDG